MRIYGGLDSKVSINVQDEETKLAKLLPSKFTSCVYRSGFFKVAATLHILHPV